MAYSFVSEISNLSEHSPRCVQGFTYLFGFILKKSAYLSVYLLNYKKGYK